MIDKNNTIVVGIGASAGGLQAIQELFHNLPSDTGMAFVIIQHLSPDFKSLMPELLAKHTEMKIFTAKDKQVIKPNCIYLNQRSKNLYIKGNELRLINKGPKQTLNLPIDIFFHSLGEEHGDQSIGIILSGTGSDGSRGIKTIKEAGGLVFAQTPKSAQFDGMPNSAIETKLCDLILPPKELGSTLASLPKSNVLKDLNLDKQTEDVVFQKILIEVQRNSGIDFTHYKRNTLLRRLEKRMGVNQVEKLFDYYTLMKSNKDECEILKQDFLIGVTRFFRDDEAFEILRDKIIPELFAKHSVDHPIRIWVPGCSTGEEVYSIAMLLEDYIRTNNITKSYKIFATDVDNHALTTASTGDYNINVASEIKPEFIDKYFIKTGNRIRINKRIRERIVFSTHDVTKDSPFIRMDLISCRNLLIYFNTQTQARVINSFNFSLNKKGYLFLGSSESLGAASKHFTTIHNKWKFFQLITKSHGARNPSSLNISITSPATHFRNNLDRFSFKDPPNKPEVVFNNYLAKRFSPTSIFVDKKFNIIYIKGKIDDKLKIQEGVFQSNLLKLVDNQLATIIRNGIRRINKEAKDIVFKNVLINNADVSYRFDIGLHKIDDFEDGPDLYLIHFDNERDLGEEIDAKDIPIDEISKQRFENLEYELKETKSELQNVVEELETSNEELQSSNEELMASNEELQSTNEELQSVNEELITVNYELQDKNKELLALSNDEINLLNSIELGILFLDENFKIRKFTPSLSNFFNLNDTDVGRPITNFASDFSRELPLFVTESAKKVLQNLVPIEKEIIGEDNRIIFVRVIPFITFDKKIDGIVITFVDITKAKEVENELLKQKLFSSGIAETSPFGIYIYDIKTGTNKFTNSQYHEILGYSPKDLAKLTSKEFSNFFHEEDQEKVSNHLQRLSTGQTESEEIEYLFKHKKGHWVWCYSIDKVFEKDSKGKPTSLIGSFIDISERKALEMKLKRAVKKGKIANIYKDQFLSNMSHEIRTPLNGILGFSKLLENPDLDEKSRTKYVKIIDRSSNRLIALIDDILDSAKIEAGELRIEQNEVLIYNLFSELKLNFDQLKKDQNKDNINIEINVPKTLREKAIITDELRLTQILSNLIGNSLKFSNRGTINIGCRKNKEFISFYVEDEGIGIPKEKQELIFERFGQGPGVDGKFDGTGLGLSIAKGLVELMDGTIKINSVVGKGTKITFDLPLQYEGTIKSKSKENSIVKENSVNGLYDTSILVADDDHLNIEYYKMILKKFNNVDFVMDGSDAVKKYKERGSYDIVLMDIRMPIMDGKQAAQEILKIDPNAKVLAQTAFSTDSEIDSLKTFGFVDIMVKPISADKMVNKILGLKS